MSRLLIYSILIAIWSLITGAFLIRIIRIQKERMLRKNSPHLEAGKCQVRRIIIEQKSGDNADIVYQPKLEYFFLEDPERKSYGLEDEIATTDLASAYAYLTEYAPKGSPYEFQAPRRVNNTIRFTKPIRPGDTLSPRLTDDDHDFLVNTPWFEDLPGPLDVKYIPGDYGINAWNLSPKSSGMVWGEFIAMVFMTVVIAWIGIGGEVAKVLSLPVYAVLIGEALIILVSLFWFDATRSRSISKWDPGFHFMVTPSTIKGNTP